MNITHLMWSDVVVSSSYYEDATFANAQIHVRKNSITIKAYSSAQGVSLGLSHVYGNPKLISIDPWSCEFEAVGFRYDKKYKVKIKAKF